MFCIAEASFLAGFSLLKGLSVGRNEVVSGESISEINHDSISLYKYQNVSFIWHVLPCNSARARLVRFYMFGEKCCVSVCDF